MQIISVEAQLVGLTRAPLVHDEAPAPLTASGHHEASREFAFDDMQLRVGERMQIKLPPKLGGGFKIVRLIGYIENRSLLVSAPDVGADEAPLVEGDLIEVRIFGGQAAFSFPSYVDRIVKLPVVYLHLTFPDRILGKAVRMARRVRTQLQARIESAAGTLDGTITNLSASGAEIVSHGDPGKLNDTLTLGFGVTAHGVVSPFKIRAVIRSLRQSGPDGGATARLGVEFQELSITELYQLNAFIYQELVERPRAAAA